MLIHLHHDAAQLLDEGRTRARILGEEATGLYPGRPWGEVESYVSGDWRAVRGKSPLDWSEVRGDAHAAWQVAKLDREGRMRDDMPVFGRT